MLSFKWQMVFILIHLLWKFTFSIDQSKNVLFMDILAKRRFLSRKTINGQNQVFVFGHRNPDTDSITSALVYASFLRYMQINAKAYRLGDLNNETKFVLKTAGIEEPDMLPSDLADGTNVALVDHNESQQSMGNLKQMRVTHVLDHHKLGDLTTSEPVYLRFEPIGCTATILTKLYRENQLYMDEKTASLLASAILSDTLHFRSSTTTDDDRSMLNYLLPIAKIIDVESYANQMFQAKSDLTGLSMQQILLLDYKTYLFNNQLWGIGMSETFYPNNILKRQDELLAAMTNEKKKSHLTGLLFSVIDISQEQNLMIILGEPENTVVQKTFNVTIREGIADLGSRMSRKKDIVPPLELYFKTNYVVYSKSSGTGFIKNQQNTLQLLIYVLFIEISFFV